MCLAGEKCERKVVTEQVKFQKFSCTWKEQKWRQTYVGSTPGSTVPWLCDLGQVTHLDWNSLLLWASKVFKDQRCAEGSGGELQVGERASQVILWPHSELNKQFAGIISFSLTHSHLDARTLFLQLRKEKQRSCAPICLRARDWQVQEQGFEPKFIWSKTHFVSGNPAHHLGCSYRSRRGHLAGTPSISHLFLPLSLLTLLNMVGKGEIILIISAITIMYFHLPCNLHTKKLGLSFSPKSKRLRRSMKSLS